MRKSFAIFLIGAFLLSCELACAQSGQSSQEQENQPVPTTQESVDSKTMQNADQSEEQEIVMEKATFGGGCFWCVEAVFQELDGVSTVTSGYMGGAIENPTYKQVCTGTTEHAEVCQVEFDPAKISFDELLQVFWTTHDPTTLNRQGNDFGTQYRSVVFYHNEAQQEKASSYKTKLNDEKVYSNPVVTEVSPAVTFYKAEEYHQDFYDKNPTQGYCAALIPPKLEKLRKVFGDKVKK